MGGRSRRGAWHRSVARDELLAGRKGGQDLLGQDQRRELPNQEGSVQDRPGPGATRLRVRLGSWVPLRLQPPAILLMLDVAPFPVRVHGPSVVVEGRVRSITMDSTGLWFGDERDVVEWHRVARLNPQMPVFPVAFRRLAAVLSMALDGWDASESSEFEIGVEIEKDREAAFAISLGAPSGGVRFSRRDRVIVCGLLDFLPTNRDWSHDRLQALLATKLPAFWPLWLGRRIVRRRLC